MSEVPQTRPKIIVVGEDEVHDLLRDCGATWDVQHPVGSVAQMWDDLSGHRLDPVSVAVVFTDTVQASQGELETAVAAMAPAAATFLVTFRPDGLSDLLVRVRDAATLQGADPEAPVHVLGPGSVHRLLDEVRATLHASGVPIDFPATWTVNPGALTVGARTAGKWGAVPVEPVADTTVSASAAPFVPAQPFHPVADVAPVAPMPPPSPQTMTSPEGPVAPAGRVAPMSPVEAVAPAAAAPLAELRAVSYLTPVASLEAPSAADVPAADQLGLATPATATPPVAAPPSVTAVAPIALAPAARVEPTTPGGEVGGVRPPSTRSATAANLPSDAHAAQPDPASRPRIMGQVTIAVTSAKGGSGKSTTAMMLAAQIAQSSKEAHELGQADRPLRVVLLDMDTRDGQVASLMGRYVPTSLNIRVQPRWDETTILDNLVHDTKLGIDCLLAPVRPRTADDVGPDFYRHVIRMLKTTHDVVILDTSVNYLDPLISTVCLPESTAILFVTTLATTSVQGMARALREITEPVDLGGMGINRRRIGIVVNQSITEVGMDRDQVLQAALRVPIVGAIPLATKDVLTCTNFNRMHQLLDHPLLGPAYFKLARTCMPNAVLAPVHMADPSTERPAATTSPAPVPPPPSAPVLAGAGTGSMTNGAAAPERRRGLFGRRS